jgi:phosphoserine phosphatase
MEEGLLSPERAAWARERYSQYKAGIVDEYTICAEMVTVHDGLPVERIRRMAARYMEEFLPKHIFPEMQRLTEQLAKAGTEIWAVSSTCDWVVEEGAKRFGIPASRILAACVEETPEGLASAKVVRVPTDELKATAIQEAIARPVDAVFGNSVHDLAMLELAAKPYAISPTEELKSQAAERGWRIYLPTL